MKYLFDSQKRSDTKNKLKISYPYNLSHCKLIIFVIIAVVLCSFYILSCFPVLNKTIFSSEEPTVIENTNSRNNEIKTIELVFENSVVPEISDYLLVRMKAKNTKGVRYPSGSFALNIGTETIDGTGNYIIQDRTKFYTDGLSHVYYVPIGENKFYINEWGPESLTLKKQIKNLTMEIPAVEGISITIEKTELKKRPFFSLDSYINYFVKNYFEISQINRYLTPAYIFIILGIIIFLIYRLILYRKPFFYLICFLVSFMFASSFYYIAGSAYNVKSYWDSYEKYILAGSLDQTYHGFYNFETFIFWVDKNIAKKENLIVLTRGEPVYIMAEMAYNLYPRDVKFINISDKDEQQIIESILHINGSEELDSYKNIIILTKSDIPYSDKIEFIASYKDNAGFIYRLK